MQQICKKAGNHLYALKRLSPYISVNHRMAIFRCFILCHFQFWPLCGMFVEWGTLKRFKSAERDVFSLRRLYIRLKFSSLQIQNAKLEIGEGKKQKTNNTNTKFKISPAFILDLYGLNALAYMAPRI